MRCEHHHAAETPARRCHAAFLFGLAVGAGWAGAEGAAGAGAGKILALALRALARRARRCRRSVWGDTGAGAEGAGAEGAGAAGAGAGKTHGAGGDGAGADPDIRVLCVRSLLEAGFSVRAIVRNKDDEEKTKHLADCAAALGKPSALEFFQGDLLKPGDYDEAFAGADAVVHTAAVVAIMAKDPQKTIVEPSLKGTANMLASVDKSGSVKRIIHTSSVAAIQSCKHTNRPAAACVPSLELGLTDRSSLQTTRGPVMFSLKRMKRPGVRSPGETLMDSPSLVRRSKFATMLLPAPRSMTSLQSTPWSCSGRA